MKLSEQLIEQAEWWHPDVPLSTNLWHYDASRATTNIGDDSSMCWLCLLEAEFQKDIEEPFRHSMELGDLIAVRLEANNND